MSKTRNLKVKSPVLESYLPLDLSFSEFNFGASKNAGSLIYIRVIDTGLKNLAPK
jgi:hypothetical protein